MTSPMATPTFSVRDLLFEPGDDRTLEQILDDELSMEPLEEKLGVFARVAQGFLVQELTRVILQMVDSDVLALMGAAWRKHTKLVEAGRRTAASPGEDEHVVLATHRMSSVQEPQIDLLVDGALLGTLDLRVSVSFHVRGLVAVVRDGRLDALRAGSCTAEAALGLEGVELVRRESRFDLGSEIALGTGIPLVPRTVAAQT